MKIAQDEIRGKRPQPGFASWRDAVNLSFPLDQLQAIALGVRLLQKYATGSRGICI